MPDQQAPFETAAWLQAGLDFISGLDVNLTSNLR